MRPHRLTFAPLLALLVTCVRHDDMSSAHAQRFEEHSDAYQSAQDAHALSVQQAPDLASISDLEDEHFARMSSHMAEMRQGATNMEGCMGNGESDALVNDMAQLDDECVRHDAAMRDAEDLEAARAEEEAHHGIMSDMMANMRSHAGPMMTSAMSMNCSHHDF